MSEAFDVRAFDVQAFDVQAFDVIVIGAGAAGLMCALTAGQRGRKVLLLDHADKVGAKILISGGGRCNFTNLHCAPDRFISANPHFHKSALDRYTQHDFIALVERHRIAYHEKTLGQLFCDGSARAIVAMLMAECATGHVDVRVAHRVTGISRADQFGIDTDKGRFTADSLVLATGALSIPKMGATFEIAGTVQRAEGVASDVQITLTGLPTGAKADPLIVKADTNPFRLKVTLPATVPAGEIRLKLSGLITPAPKLLPNQRLRNQEIGLILNIQMVK